MKTFVIITTTLIFITCSCILFTIINEYKAINENNNTEYKFTVTDNFITVYDSNNIIGTVKLQGQLDSLLIDYNQ